MAGSAFGILSGDPNIQHAGGAEVQQVILAKALASRGHAVSMMCDDHGQPSPIRIDGVTVHKAYRRVKLVPVVSFAYKRYMLWRAMRQVDADIYYQRTAGVGIGFVVAFCRRAGKKSVFAGAGNPDFEFHTSRVTQKYLRWIYRYGVRNADQIVVQNREQEELCRSNYGRDGVLVNSCYEPPVGARSDPQGYILWVSTIRQLKRPEQFLALARACPDLEFRMVGGPSRNEGALYDRIEREARTLQNLDFRGFVPFGQVEEHFNGARLFVNTSESEGFPNTFLQSWARAIPTVSFIDCGARLEGAPVGRIVASFDGMVELVDLLVNDDAACAREGERCKRYFIQNNTVDIAVSQYEAIFERLLSLRPVD